MKGVYKITKSINKENGQPNDDIQFYCFEEKISLLYIPKTYVKLIFFKVYYSNIYQTTSEILNKKWGNIKEKN